MLDEAMKSHKNNASTLLSEDVGITDGDTTGTIVGRYVGLGIVGVDDDGISVGSNVGCSVGVQEGMVVGICEGLLVGN